MLDSSQRTDMTEELESLSIDGPAGKLRVWHSPTAERDDRTPVLFVHPINLQGRIWEDVVWRLTPPRYCLLPDLRGHGGSDATGPFGLEHWIDDCVAVLDAFEVEHAHVVGGSLGGTIACGLAARVPDRVASISAFGSAVTLSGADLESVLETLKELGVKGMFQKVFPEITFAPGTAPALIERAVEIANPNDVPTVSEIWRATLAADATEATRTIASPALVVTGEHDVTCSPQLGLELARVLGTNLVLVPGIGHMPMMERPQEVSSLLNAHFASQERRGEEGPHE